MREGHIVSLHFTEAEVLEALKLWCQHNHAALADHFKRRASFDWRYDEKADADDLVVMFDGEILT